MIRFKTFLEQVTAQRAMERLKWMRKPSDPHAIYDKPEHQPHHIKLPFARGKRHVAATYTRDGRNNEWNSRAGVKRKYRATRLSQLVSSPSKLNFSQERTSAGDENQLASKSDPDRTKRHIKILSYRDKSGQEHHTVEDGHHALIGMIARGHDPIVSHCHLDKERQYLAKNHPESEPKERQNHPKWRWDAEDL